MIGASFSSKIPNGQDKFGAPAEAITPVSTSNAIDQADVKSRSTCHITLRRIVKFAAATNPAA